MAETETAPEEAAPTAEHQLIAALQMTLAAAVSDLAWAQGFIEKVPTQHPEHRRNLLLSADLCKIASEKLKGRETLAPGVVQIHQHCLEEMQAELEQLRAEREQLADFLREGNPDWAGESPVIDAIKVIDQMSTLLAANREPLPND